MMEEWQPVLRWKSKTEQQSQIGLEQKRPVGWTEQDEWSDWVLSEGTHGLDQYRLR